MAQRFIACDREQSFLMPPDVREWLPEGHLAWFVLDAVGAMDLVAFSSTARRPAGCDRPRDRPHTGRQEQMERAVATKFNRKLERFHRRGRSAVRTEWRLITAPHNLLKLHRHQLATAAA
jgi:hypothetical protein